ncbi:MAG: outer membrane protein assembly factor BamA, partial [Paludibacteraceae bacterium]|nr:outer membrane protein assembly factor BamA [Paludibacteraceae bacterium]
MKEDLERPVNKFVSILLCLSFLLPVAAQNDSVSVVSDTVSVVEKLPVIEYTMQRKTYEIADITVSGAESYEDFVLIGFSGLAVGDKIEVPGDQITKSLQRFWKQGLFSDVKIKAKKIVGDKIWLEIALEQRPRISDVVYNGLKKSEIEDVEVKIGIQKNGQMTPNLEDGANKVIIKYLEEKGFYDATVKVL